MVQWLWCASGGGASGVDGDDGGGGASGVDGDGGGGDGGGGGAVVPGGTSRPVAALPGVAGPAWWQYSLHCTVAPGGSVPGTTGRRGPSQSQSSHHYLPVSWWQPAGE